MSLLMTIYGDLSKMERYLIMGLHEVAELLIMKLMVILIIH